MPYLERDGTRLFYEDRGSGGAPLLLSHGLMNDHSYFEPQLNELSDVRRVVAVDLRGHGKSDKPEQTYTIQGLADDLAWISDQLGLDGVVAVGHSLGGATSLQLAADSPDMVSAAIVLDSPVVPPPDFGTAMGQLAEGANTPAYQDVIRGFISQFVGFQDDPERADRLVEEMASTPQHVTASCLSAYVDWDSAAAADAVTAPVLYVSSGPWFTQVEEFRELCPQLVTAQTVGSGHYHQLEVPDQINAMIRRFVEVATSSPA
jgi:pimeloyl-ACP methyl ester carboxylesterase